MRHIYQMLTELPIGKSQLSAVYSLRIKTKHCQNLVTCKAKKKRNIYIYTHIHTHIYIYTHTHIIIQTFPFYYHRILSNPHHRINK